MIAVIQGIARPQDFIRAPLASRFLAFCRRPDGSEGVFREGRVSTGTGRLRSSADPVCRLLTRWDHASASNTSRAAAVSG